jgi:hypothetical protein
VWFRTLVKVPFGKFRGQQISDVPLDYLCWLIDVAQGPLREAIEDELRWRRAQRWHTTPPVAAIVPAPAKTLDLIEAGFRVLAKTHHPDRGGDHATMVEVLAARAWLRERVGA